MRIPRHLKMVTDLIFNHSQDIGSMLIATTILGWVASSTAQVLGIIKNDKYSKEQKNFMINQEIGDAMINIGTFFIITTPIKKLASKMVSTGKLLPKSLQRILIKNNDGPNLGKLDFKVIDRPYLSQDMKKTYNSFHNFMSTSSAVLGGIISSNIVTPILRNKYAAKRQHKLQDIQKPIDNQKPNINTINTKYTSTFSQFKKHNLSI